MRELAAKQFLAVPGVRAEVMVATVYGSDAESVPDGPHESVSRSRAYVATADGVALYREHFLHLTRLAAMLVGDRESAEDIVQDVFASMHKRWRRLSDPTCPKAAGRPAR